MGVTNVVIKAMDTKTEAISPVKTPRDNPTLTKINSTAPRPFMPVATITSKGQVTLPRVIREKLNLSAGDKIDFCFDEELQKVILTPKNKKVEQVRGLLSHYAKEKPVRDQEMREAIGDYIVEKFK